MSITDSFPVPICRFARAPGCKRLASEADFGYDDVADQIFYGLRAHVTISWPGVIRLAELAAANESDTAMAPKVLEGIEGWVLADPSYWSPEFFEQLAGESLALLAPFGAQNTRENALSASSDADAATHRNSHLETDAFYEDARPELYDLKTDIGETDNLAGEMPEKTRRMQ